MENLFYKIALTLVIL